MSQPLSGSRYDAGSPSVSPSASSVAFGSPAREPAHVLERSKEPRETAWTVRRTRPVERKITALRRYDISWCATNGDIVEKQISAPALPAFENAFNGFARGALIPTRMGPVAIEDLLPGDEVETLDGRYEPVQWIGSMPLDIKGQRSEDATPEKLYRIMADSFGLGRPAPDLMLGAGARLLIRKAALRAYLGQDHALAPITGLVDGMSVIEVSPASTVRSYHFALARHALIRVNGIEVESFHPGQTAAGMLQGPMRTRYMDLFPHLNSLGDFGAMTAARLSPTDMLELAL